MNLFWQDVLSLFLNRPCPLCDRVSPQVLCSHCQAQVRETMLDVKLCNAEWHGAIPLFAWGRYEGSLKRTIAALKYENSPRLALLLGRWMAERWQETLSDRAPQPPLIVVPIPIHPAKLKTRGFNQAALLAQVFCRYTRFPFLPQGLIRVKATTAQFGLSKSDRFLNLKNAFDVNPKFKPILQKKAVLLLDDIYTTGSTAQSTLQTLQQHHIRVYGMATLART